MKKFLVLLTVIVILGCAGAPGPIPQRLPAESLQATAFTCPDGYRFAVHWTADGERAEVLLPNATAFLTRAVSGSGARYTAANIELWNKGEEAYLRLYDRERSGCRQDRGQSVALDARFRGVAFRGEGNAPAWVLEMGREMMVMVIGEDGKTSVFPLSRAIKGPTEKQPAPDIRQEAVSGEHRLRVEASPVDCRDTMSGAAYPYRVRIELDKDIFRGCGGWLAPPPE